MLILVWNFGVYLVGFDWSKFLLLYENICNLSGFGNFYYVYIFIDFC